MTRETDKWDGWSVTPDQFVDTIAQSKTRPGKSRSGPRPAGQKPAHVEVAESIIENCAGKSTKDKLAFMTEVCAKARLQANFSPLLLEQLERKCQDYQSELDIDGIGRETADVGNGAEFDVASALCEALDTKVSWWKRVKKKARNKSAEYRLRFNNFLWRLRRGLLSGMWNGVLITSAVLAPIVAIVLGIVALTFNLSSLFAFLTVLPILALLFILMFATEEYKPMRFIKIAFAIVGSFVLLVTGLTLAWTPINIMDHADEYVGVFANKQSDGSWKTETIVDTRKNPKFLPGLISGHLIANAFSANRKMTWLPAPKPQDSIEMDFVSPANKQLSFNVNVKYDQDISPDIGNHVKEWMDASSWAQGVATEITKSANDESKRAEVPPAMTMIEGKIKKEVIASVTASHLTPNPQSVRDAVQSVAKNYPYLKIDPSSVEILTREMTFKTEKWDRGAAAVPVSALTAPASVPASDSNPTSGSTSGTNAGAPVTPASSTVPVESK